MLNRSCVEMCYYADSDLVHYLERFRAYCLHVFDCLLCFVVQFRTRRRARSVLRLYTIQYTVCHLVSTTPEWYHTRGSARIVSLYFIHSANIAFFLLFTSILPELFNALAVIGERKNCLIFFCHLFEMRLWCVSALLIYLRPDLPKALMFWMARWLNSLKVDD